MVKVLSDVQRTLLVNSYILLAPILTLLWKFNSSDDVVFLNKWATRKNHTLRLEEKK